MSDEQQLPPLPSPPHFASAPPQRPEVPSSQRFPTWKQALVLLFGSWALMASASFGCRLALDHIGGGGGAVGEAIPVVLAIIVVAGLVGTLVGILFVLIRMLHALFGNRRGRNEDR